MLSPRMSADGPPPTKSRPMTNACASPFGVGCSAYENRTPHCDPLPSSSRKRGKIRRRRDHEEVANAREHQRRERVVDHRLVVHGQQLLAHDERQRMQPRSRRRRRE